MEGELLCLKWRDHSSSLFRTLSSVRKKEVYCDATIACDGRFYPVHKFVLSTCSDYFEQMFEVGEQKNLMIVLTDIGCEELETLLDYMYFGEVNVLQSDLNSFMKAAERLRIKGLAEPSEPEHTIDRGEKRTRNQHENSQEIRRKKRRSGEMLLNLERPQSIPNVQAKDSQDKIAKTSSESINKELPNQRKDIESFPDVPISTPLETVELESDIASNMTNKELMVEAQREEIKQEPFVKPEPEDWHPVESIADSSMYIPEPETPYLPPTSVSVNTSGICSVKDTEIQHSQHSEFSGPSQLFPGPSGLHSAQPWDHGRPTAPLPSEEFTQYRGIISHGSLSPRKTGRPTSDIWNHYKTEKRNGKNFVICIYCTTQKYGYPNATKMKIHTVKCIMCPEHVRKQYKEELAQTVAKSEASKSLAVKQISSVESQRL
ncbi:protein bric-a-brac 1-like isoform X1 [Palaemon carinicauda]|uniref:protein bric-a-brac 1-like isoform X1 n=1 Tax=Palaemon carinicauda TaxID=392227 RepID=UPI0035B57169